MKKIIASLVVLTMLISCGDAENPTYVPEGDFVQFETASTSTAEDGDAVTIDVALGSTDNPNGTSVNFDVNIASGDASRYTIEPSNGVLDIPAGEFTGEITITPIDNLDNDGNVELTLELVSSSNLGVGVAGIGLEKVEASVVINDNDCPTVISEEYGVDVFALGGQAPSHSVEFVPVDGTDNQWTITSSWGPNFVGWATGNAANNGAFLYAGTVTLNEDFSVDFDGERGTGTGTYSACDNQFSITIDQNLFTTDFTVDLVMTGN